MKSWSDLRKNYIILSQETGSNCSSFECLESDCSSFECSESDCSSLEFSDEGKDNVNSVSGKSSVIIKDTSVLNPIPRFLCFRKDGIDICANDEHPEKVQLPISVTEEGIVICVNDEHSEKTDIPIEVTEEGIAICVNDEHS